MFAKYHTVHTQHYANQHHTVHERTFHCTQVSTVCCMETLRYTLSTIIAFFLIQQKVEDGKFCETQQVKLSRVLASQGRDVVLSCVVSVESGAVVECKPDRSLTADRLHRELCTPDCSEPRFFPEPCIPSSTAIIEKTMTANHVNPRFLEIITICTEQKKLYLNVKS